MIPRLLYTPGEPAGIGPDLCKFIAEGTFDSEIVVVGDPELIFNRLFKLGCHVDIEVADLSKPSRAQTPGKLKVLPIKLNSEVTPGELNVDNASYVLNTLDTAIDACLLNSAQALVTGPVQKSVINQAGIPFTGHTEYLENKCKSEKVVMMLATDELRVALVTTHLPLREVPDAITPALLNEVMATVVHSLEVSLGIQNARLLVCGLNPHAGEDGHLGTEDRDIIKPAVEYWKAKGQNIVGPLPADTLFTEHNLEKADAVLAMYHDQGLPVLKHRGFGRAVNITLGLPIVRTSVDHGTALNLAATGRADSGSLATAIAYAERMAMSKLREQN